MTQTETSKPLDYAPPPPLHQRRSYRQALFALVALFLVLILAPLVIRGVQHARLLYWQRQCMNATRSPETIVWSAGGNSAAKPHPAWSEFYALLSPPGSLQFSTVFLHGCDAGAGERLVVVDLHLNLLPNGIPSMSSRVIAPGTLTTRPRELSHVLYQGELHKLPKQIFAGQVDEQDRSHFTIDYVLDNGTRHTLDGWLLPDDSVVIEPR